MLPSGVFMPECQISFGRAREYIKKLEPLGVEDVDISHLAGRTIARPITASLDSPSSGSSLKDGYAVVSDDISNASKYSPVDLTITGTILAGDAHSITIKPGEAARIMTGASIPEGATAVLASEFSHEHADGKKVTAFADAGAGKNILEKGGEIRAGQCLADSGQLITPAFAGLLAASGVGNVPVYTLPVVALVATGSEIVRQGTALASGQIFQSNQYVTRSWLNAYGFKAEIFLVRDDYQSLKAMIVSLLPRFDIIITSGGLLAGDRDLVLPVMEELGTEYFFQRVKMGPGKGVCLGTCNGKIIFNLPGGPPSNYLAFMLLALPGVLKISGRTEPFRPILKARLETKIMGRREWTQFSFAQKRREGDGRLSVSPCDPGSRLMKIAMSDCVIEVPEGTDVLERGQLVNVHDFSFQPGTAG